MAKITDDFGNVVRTAQEGVVNPNFRRGPVSPEAAAWRASQAAPVAPAPAPAAAPAPAVSPTPANTGRMARAASGLNAVLDADVSKLPGKAVSAAKGVGGKAVQFASEGLGRAALPVTAMASAAGSYDTSTDDYYQRTGIDREATHVPQFMKDLGVRALGTLQDFGNAVTFGLADRAGNAIAGNGFGHSDAYEAKPAAAATPATAVGGSPNDQSAAETARLNRQEQAAAQAASAPAAEPVDWAARKAERDALTQKEMGLANQMEADRLAKEKAGYEAQQGSVRVAQGIQDKMEAEQARRSAQVTLSSIAAKPEEKAAAMASLRDMDARAAQGDKLKSDEFNWGRKNANDMAIAGMRDATDRRGQDVQKYGMDSTAQTAGLRAKLDAAKYGQERMDKNAERREALIKSRSMRTITDKDGKPHTYEDANYANELRRQYDEMENARDAQGNRIVNLDATSPTTALADERRMGARANLRSRIDNATGPNMSGAPMSSKPLQAGDVGGERPTRFGDIFDPNTNLRAGGWARSLVSGGDHDSMVEINRGGKKVMVLKSGIVRNENGDYDMDAANELESLRRK